MYQNILDRFLRRFKFCKKFSIWPWFTFRWPYYNLVTMVHFVKKNYTRAIQNRFLKKVSNISQIPYMLSLESVLWVPPKILVAISLIFIDIFDFCKPPHFPLERLKGFGGGEGFDTGLGLLSIWIKGFQSEEFVSEAPSPHIY